MLEKKIQEKRVRWDAMQESRRHKEEMEECRLKIEEHWMTIGQKDEEN